MASRIAGAPLVVAADGFSQSAHSVSGRGTGRPLIVMASEARPSSPAVIAELRRGSGGVDGFASLAMTGAAEITPKHTRRTSAPPSAAD